MINHLRYTAGLRVESKGIGDVSIASGSENFNSCTCMLIRIVRRDIIR